MTNEQLLKNLELFRRAVEEDNFWIRKDGWLPDHMICRNKRFGHWINSNGADLTSVPNPLEGIWEEYKPEPEIIEWVRPGNVWYKGDSRPVYVGSAYITWFPSKEKFLAAYPDDFKDKAIILDWETLRAPKNREDWMVDA
jgi:hypothetical protein